ncbi:hypothetical protein Q4575_13250 [Psychrosphaera sp. 1_MG-2023]|uniref:hypothetical protein n=1 Tax=Psychrosphaera sp. 1_MG-2023 TaxID=3062643 RepID=UPI0026E292BD|nr:hypothetical protein [Psychrosphaera sp. 1_MG-2023]MDO6720378.1 hypothetical protein [Psychrosphaera sp. 1_MG-2023]
MTRLTTMLMLSTLASMLMTMTLTSCSGNKNDDEPKKIVEDDSVSEFSNYTAQSTEVTTLFDWNDASDAGHTWLGWIWQDDVAYGKMGWILGTGGLLGDGESVYFGIGPRSFDKKDYGDENLVEIVPDIRAPMTSEGGSFRVYDNPEEVEAPNQASWWLLYDSKPLIERGITKEDTDRLSFYIKLGGLDELDDSGGSETITTNFHVGTYLCWETGEPVYSTGDGCPREGPGNQHYYHYLSLNPGAWLHVELDDHPNHHRGSSGGSYHENNPVAADGKNYFAQMSRIYMEVRSAQTTDSEYYLDEVEFYSTKQSHEPDQNDESITSLWVGYWPDSNYWELGFKDGVDISPGKDKLSTFEIRWSINPITNANYAEANIVEPMLYSGEKYVGTENPHYLRRESDYTRNVWTRFELPTEITDNYEMVYFAIKDVSKKGENQGTSWPWNREDHGQDVSPYIRAINYALKAPQL